MHAKIILSSSLICTKTEGFVRNNVMFVGIRICSGPTGLAGRYRDCHNGDSENRKGLPSVCLVWVSPLLKQPDRSFNSDILYGVSKPI